MYRLRRFLPVALLLVTVTAGCGGGRASGGKTDGMGHIRDWYSRVAPGHQPPPAWVFCLPEQGDTIYGLGFALQHMSGDEATLQNAYDSAIYNLARSVKVSVKARKYIQTETTALSMTDQLLVEKEEHIDSQVEQLVRAKAQQLEDWKDMSNGVTWVLAAVSLSDLEQLKTTVRSRTRCRIGQRPDWLIHPPARKGVLYGIGESRMHWNPAESYREAERLALIQISEQIRARVTGFDDRKSSEHEDYTYKIVRIATEGDLSGSDIVSRWVDFRTGVAFALARMPLISVKSQILAAARKVEAEEKAKVKEDVEERGALSAEEIERKAEDALEMMDRALDKNFGGGPLELKMPSAESAPPTVAEESEAAAREAEEPASGDAAPPSEEGDAPPAEDSDGGEG